MSQGPHFDDLAARYDELRPFPERGPLVSALVREGRLPGRRLLDIGCGTGAALAVLTRRYKVVGAGVEPSRAMLAEARRNLGWTAVVEEGVAERLPFPDGAFDAALMRLVVQHIDRPRAFREALRILRQGGRLLVVTTDPAALDRMWLARLFPSYAEVERRRFPDAASLERELRDAGFAEVHVVPLSVPRRFSRAEALRKLRGRYASTLELLPEDELRAGLERAERDLPDPVTYTLEYLLVVAERA
jgi:SAM-dependent methyltransferase